MWLPLPHLLNMVPVQVDAWYRTGASATAISVLAMALGAGSLASLLLRVTGSVVAAVTGAVLLLANPNVLYLQSTPMTEPLLFGLTLFSVAATAAWVDRVSLPPEGGSHPGAGRSETFWPGLAMTGACLTRYEAWAITGAILALAFLVLVRRGIRLKDALAAVARLAMWPAVTILVFSMNSRWVVGSWFVSNDFFNPDNTEALGKPLVAWRQIREGLTPLTGPALPLAAYGGAALLAWTFVRSQPRASLALLLALFAAAALPLTAYVQGHPFRIRYDVPLVVACAAVAAGGIGLLWRIARLPVAIALVAIVMIQAPPLDRTAPIIRESTRETGTQKRRPVTSYLQQHYDGTGIMMSMGSLGHYMHDLSLAGFSIEDFLHEGNGEIWRFAMLGPRGHAGWLIIEGSAEGGDALHHASRRDRWLDGFEKVAEGGGASLYRATRPDSVRSGSAR